MSHVLERLTELGISLHLNGDRITARPKQAVTGEVADIIRRHKRELVSELSPKPGDDYTLADLAEMDRLIRQLAMLEGWDSSELDARLSERRRMAPANVVEALQALRAAARAALAPWPERPAERATIALCRLT